MVSVVLLMSLMVIPFKNSVKKIQTSDRGINNDILTFSHLHSNAELEGKSINKGKGKEKILYYDEDIIVVEKPPFLQTVPGYDEEMSLATIIANSFSVDAIENMSPHRLDYQTSGIVIFTRNINSLKSIQEQFRQSLVYKRYVAVVHGVPSHWEGEIDLPIGKDTINGPPLQAIDPSNGRNALTYWKVLSVWKNATVLDLIPRTGRTHQLRLHMAAIGHPILGDLFYAPSSIYKASKRLMLHAQEIRFYHPRNNQPMKIVSSHSFRPEQCKVP